MVKEKKKIGEIANLFYIFACIFSFGTVWLCKVVIQKAITDAHNS